MVSLHGRYMAGTCIALRTCALCAPRYHPDQIDNYLLLIVPGDGVKGKTWGPSSALSNVKQRPTITETQNRWKAISAPSLEKGSPRNLANIPTVGTVPEGEYPSD